MSLLAPPPDLQLEFWTLPEPEREQAPASLGPARTVGVKGRRVGGERTLEDLVLGAWEGLAAHRPVDCPVCGGVMAPRVGAQAELISASCRNCGSQLS